MLEQNLPQTRVNVGKYVFFIKSGVLYEIKFISVNEFAKGVVLVLQIAQIYKNCSKSFTNIMQQLSSNHKCLYASKADTQSNSLTTSFCTHFRDNSSFKDGAKPGRLAKRAPSNISRE